MIWCISRQGDRNGETVKHFHNCIKVLSHFRTLYKSVAVQKQAEARRCAWQCADTILIICASNLCARELCRPIIAAAVAIVTCKKTYFPQIVLIQYKAKPHLGYQNLGCHCKILGCHFDTQNGLKNTGRIHNCKKICTLIDFKDPLKSILLQQTRVQTGFSCAAIEFISSRASILHTCNHRNDEVIF